MNQNLLENPSYSFFKKISSKIPYNLRQKIKDQKLPELFEFVKWVIIDLQRPRYFHPYGLYFFVGLPGAGKTMFLTYMLQKYREKYGDSIYIATNYHFVNQDFAINSYEDIIKVYDKPVIVGYDEIQNDFDSRNWANLDYAFSERITQSRKINGMMILATAQKFGFVDKRLRQLTHEVFDCNTFLDRLTVGKIYEPDLKEKIEEGQYIDYNSNKTKGFKLFTQTDKLRELYDTYQILEQVRKKIEKANEENEFALSQLSKIFKTSEEAH